MTLKRLINLTLLVVLAFSLMSCSPKQKVEPVSDGYRLPTLSKASYPVINLPAWLLYLPEGDNAIGIAWDSPNKPKSVLNSSREFAAVSLSRNKSSFVVDKSAVINYAEQNEVDLQKADFRVVVSADTSYLNYADKNLKSYAEATFHGYKVFLYGIEQPVVNNDIVRASVANTPKWCKGNETFEDADYVYTVGYAQEISLITAWKNAQEDGLRKLAQYRLTNVIATLRSTEDQTKKTTIIETVTHNPDTAITKTWLFPKTVDNVSSYSVFLMLRAKKTI
jgi:hypothetical protein